MSFFEFKNLKKSFSSCDLFDDISYCFPETGFVSLLGNSSCGKTTLLYILIGLENKDAGNIYYSNKELITKNDFRLLRKDCSFVFQEYGVLNYLNGKDNLLMGGFDFDETNDFIKKSHLDKKTMVLSGGEKQRLALLKAIKSNPKIIFCDEPTGSLDDENGKIVLNALKKISKKSLVIMVSHNHKLVNEFSDIILELNSKRLIIQKTMDSLYKTKNTNITIRRNFLKGIKISIKSFFQDRIKIIFALLSFVFSIASLNLVFNLNNYSQDVISNNIETYADYRRLKVSMIEKHSIEGTSFSLSKILRPNKFDFYDSIKESCELEYNLDYFLSFANIKYNNNQINIPLISFPFGSGIDDIRMNIQAREIIQDINNKIEIEIHQNVLSQYKNEICTDKVSLYIESFIHTIYKEFNFMNTPCLFISHDALKDYMKGVELINFSKTRGIFTSLYDRYTAFTTSDDIYSSYSYYVDVKNMDDVIDIYNYLSSLDNYSVESRAMYTASSLLSSFELIKILMSIFSYISIVLTLLLIYLLLNASFIKRKKEFALYKTYGYSSFECFMNVLIPFLMFILIGFLVSIAIYKIGIIYLNYTLFKYFSFNLFNNEIIVYKEFILILIFIALISSIFSFLFTKHVNNIKVSEVIKSE